jgi:hypothetical protein
MNSWHFVRMIAALSILVASCSSGGGSYGSGGYSSSGYTSSNGGSAGTIGSDVSGVIHEEKQDERIKRAQKAESLMAVSGFKSMPIDTPAKQKVIQGLTPLSFTMLGHHGKIHYWYADPYYCNCVYVGDELAYLRYKQSKKERKQEEKEEVGLYESENAVSMPIDSQWDPYGAFDMP